MQITVPFITGQWLGFQVECDPEQYRAVQTKRTFGEIRDWIALRENPDSGILAIQRSLAAISPWVEDSVRVKIETSDSSHHQG